MSNKIPTAEEMALQRNGGDYTHFEEIVELMKEFAQLHVEAALKAAYEKRHACKEAILNAYPKGNIL